MNLIGRYPRYRELWERFHLAGGLPERAEKYFQVQDFTDLQVLSQIAGVPRIFGGERGGGIGLKGRNYTLEDQRFVIVHERELLGRVLPAHAEAANKGRIEISTSPFYHPILPLLCDTQMGAVSSPGWPCRRTAIAIRKMLASSCNADWICTKKCLGYGQKGCGRRRAAFPKRHWRSRTNFAAGPHGHIPYHADTKYRRYSRASSNCRPTRTSAFQNTANGDATRRGRRGSPP